MRFKSILVTLLIAIILLTAVSCDERIEDNTDMPDVNISSLYYEEYTITREPVARIDKDIAVEFTQLDVSKLNSGYYAFTCIVTNTGTVPVDIEFDTKYYSETELVGGSTGLFSLYLKPDESRMIFDNWNIPAGVTRIEIDNLSVLEYDRMMFFPVWTCTRKEEGGKEKFVYDIQTVVYEDDKHSRDADIVLLDVFYMTNPFDGTEHVHEVWSHTFFAGEDMTYKVNAPEGYTRHETYIYGW